VRRINPNNPWVAGSLSLFAVVSLPAFGQQPPPSALINQQSEETVEAARAASPRDTDETFAYFADEVEAALTLAAQRVWDPTQPREPSPRTTWGDPDLSGYWMSVSYTPLERPDELAGKALYTTEEAIEAFQRAVTSDAGVDPATVHYDWTEFGMDMWQSPIKPNHRTSLIIDPPDGKMPALTDGGRARFAENARRHTLPSRALTERCIVGSEGPPRIPFVQNIHESQIVQTPDHVVLIAQSNSDVRIIPLDGRQSPPATIRSFLGESRGHWEGDTLVIETTNFHPERKWVRPQEMGGDLHLVERLTRIDEGTVLYEATMTDPTVWEAPWTIEIPWPKLEPPGLFEFACHEQNYGLINVLRGARVRAAEFEAAQQAED
jgi:hypothetical protein